MYHGFAYSFTLSILLIVPILASCSSKHEPPGTRNPSADATESLADEGTSVRTDGGANLARISATDAKAPDDNGKQTMPCLKIMITPEGAQSRMRIALALEVVNVGAEPIQLDSELCIFFNWVARDDACRFIHLTHLESLDVPAEARTKDRFISIKPGESIKRDFLLTQASASV